MKNKLQLIYIHLLGLNSENKFEYTFYFSPIDYIMCNENWKENIAGMFNDDFIPDENIQAQTLITSIPLSIINTNSCLGMKHAIDGVVALAWEDITYYEEYPENGRLVFYYGTDYNDIVNMLTEKNEFFNN